jgi:hypothetical protein
MSSPPPPPGTSSGGPTIRLNISKGGAGAGAGSSNNNTPPTTKRSASPPPAKKHRTFTPQTSVRPNNAIAYNLNLLHQKTSLSFVLERSSQLPTSEPEWHARGHTSLYVLLDEAPFDSSSNNNPNTPSILQLALHLRGTCHVSNVTIESVQKKDLSSLTKLSCSYQHMDPLEKVLLKPAVSYTVEDVLTSSNSINQQRHEADSQSSRGAVGMTNGLRAASIASNMGELRMSAVYQHLTKDQQQSQQTDKVVDCWKRDLLCPIPNDGEALDKLRERLEPRISQRKATRIDWLSTALANASTSNTNTSRALKITVQYQMALGKHFHFGGINALTANRTPHVYTTAGVYGDHEGPRCWIPCLDSASTKHRASHELNIKVTAPMSEGLSVVGFGEDYGVMENFLHDPVGTDSQGMIAKELGSEHVKMLQSATGIPHNSDSANAPHLIPPESSQNASVDSIYVTSVWSSSSWLPVPARALGFAIGPFRVLEDPEYFCKVEADDASEEAQETLQALDTARQNGEGIRQVYFAPVFARKHIHANANSTLMPNTKIHLSPLSKRQVELCEGLDQSVLTATVGVPHRALSLMRDILAVPAFRTVSYTQIWIPHAVHGGSTSGALHCCPEILVNSFLGGAIMDSRLLPPVGHRLPFHQGGRTLQMLQARCATRGWLISALPLGGQDDVGQGYLHTLIESLLMSLYERGHGAHGEGKSFIQSLH